MHFKREVRCDSRQEPRGGMWDMRCPKCHRLLGIIEDLHGIVSLRFKCPKCGTFVIADLERTGVTE